MEEEEATTNCGRCAGGGGGHTLVLVRGGVGCAWSGRR
jgi:hypothetical protein